MHKFGEYLKYKKAATEVYQTEKIRKIRDRDPVLSSQQDTVHSIVYILRVLHRSFKNTAIRTFVEKSLYLKNVGILILTGDSFEGRTSQAFWTLHYKINRKDLK